MNQTLPATLAQRVRFLREQRFLTPEYVSHKAQIPLKQIEDIEAGIETFLAPSVRMRLARVLHVRPGQIREVERPPAPAAETPALQDKGLELIEAIEADPQGEYHCPRCEAPLVARVFERRDLQDNAFNVIKANCTRCLFRLTND